MAADGRPPVQGPDPSTNYGWAALFLSALGAPINNANLAFIMGWIRAEGTEAQWNPLATTKKGFGEVSEFNSIGVKNYPTADAGIAASVATLRLGYYPTILKALLAGNPQAALGASQEWTTYSGGTDYGRKIWSYAQDYIGDPAGTAFKIKAAGGPGSSGYDLRAAGGGGAGGAGGVDEGFASIEEEIRVKFGQYAWLLDVPEVGDILRQGAEQNLSFTQVVSRLQQTEWWKQHTASQRDWLTTLHNDPASARQLIQKAEADIDRIASTLGITLDPGRRYEMALNFNRFGWSPDDLQRAIAAEARFGQHGKATAPGAITAGAGDIQSLAADYGLTLSDQAAFRYEKQTLTGEINNDTLVGIFQSQAAALYPSLAEAINRGATVKQLLDQNLQVIAQTLEIDPSEINIALPKWSNLFFGRDRNGEHRTLGLLETQQRAMTDSRYGFDSTRQARDEATNLAIGLAQSFGYVS